MFTLGGTSNAASGLTLTRLFFLSVCLISERAVQERDPGKESWRTCTKTSRPLNVPLLCRTSQTLQVHQISLFFAGHFEGDVTLLPSCGTGTFLSDSNALSCNRQVNGNKNLWIAPEGEGNQPVCVLSATHLLAHVQCVE